MMKRYGLILISLAFLSLISRWVPVPAIIAQGVSRGPLIMQNGGTPIGAAITFNCSTGLTCTNSGGTVTATASGTSLSLETNGTPNGSQSLLNLEQGTGITLVDDGSGGVTISSTGGAGAANPSCTFSALDTGCTAPTTSIDVSSLVATSNDQFLVQCWTGASTTQTAVAVTSYVYTTGSGIIQTVAPAFSAAAAAGYCVANGNGSGGSGGSSTGWVLLEEHTASSSAEIDFTSRNVTGQSGASFQSDFNDYVLRIVTLQVGTNGADPLMQFSTNGGSSYDTGNNYFWSHINIVVSTSTTGSNAGNNVSGISLFASSGGVGPPASANPGLSLSMDIPAPLASGVGKTISSMGSSRFNGDGNLFGYSLWGFWNGTTGANAFRIIPSSGNLASGTFRLYGVSQ